MQAVALFNAHTGIVNWWIVGLVLSLEYLQIEWKEADRFGEIKWTESRPFWCSLLYSSRKPRSQKSVTFMTIQAESWTYLMITSNKSSHVLLILVKLGSHHCSSSGCGWNDNAQLVQLYCFLNCNICTPGPVDLHPVDMISSEQRAQSTSMACESTLIRTNFWLLTESQPRSETGGIAVSMTPWKRIAMRCHSKYTLLAILIYIEHAG